MCTMLAFTLATCVLPSLAASGAMAIERPRDELVLNAVLVHFLGDVASDGGHFANERQKVVLHKRNPESTGLLDQTLNLARNRNGHSEAIEDVLRRNVGANNRSKPFCYEKFQLDKRIQIGDIAATEGYLATWDALDKFKGLLEFHAPGYSKDGGTAVVMGFCWPTHHVTGVVYYLKLEGGAWIVKWRAFAWYV